MPQRQLRGVGVSPGVAVGPALVVRWEVPPVPERAVAASEVGRELERLHEAVAWARERIERTRERALVRAGPDEARIFDAQLMMLQDADLLGPVERLIR